MTTPARAPNSPWSLEKSDTAARRNPYVGTSLPRSRRERVASMFGREVKGASRAAFVGVAALCASVTGLAGAAIAGAVTQQTLVGAWSGPPIGDTGECGRGLGEYAFSPDGTYRYTVVYDNCDAVLVDGHYQLQADGGVLQISIETCGQEGCPPGPSILTTSISAVDPDSIVLDGHYTYHRQRG
jgi:hypothetical protein